MVKRIIEPNTTLYPVPVVLITTGGDTPNVMTLNRIASCSAEPPRLAISVRPMRHSHSLIQSTREFVVNIPAPTQQLVSDYVGVVSGRGEDKFSVANMQLTAASKVRTPLLAQCPVNIECIVEQEIALGSHTMFIGLVQAVHADETLLDARGEIDFTLAQGLIYQSAIVRERPTYHFQVDELRKAAQLS